MMSKEALMITMKSMLSLALQCGIGGGWNALVWECPIKEICQFVYSTNVMKHLTN